MTTGERLRSYWTDRELSRERLASLAGRYWEIGLIAAIMLVALILRLWDLDGRAVHHDESIHMKFSWDLFQNLNNYDHSPTYHGPFEIFGTAAIFRIFGDSDFTGRLLPALFGTALVGLPFFMRGMLGRTGVFIAAAFLALSPTLWYFSRFARNDIYIAVYTLGMAIIMWRYLKEQKQSYLFGIPLLLMLGFATKEVTFITTAIFLVYLEFRLATDLVDKLRASRTMRPQDIALAYAVLLPFAWLVVALWPLLAALRKRLSISEMPAAGHLMVITGTFALPQFAAGIQQFPVGGLDGGFMGERTLMMITVLLAIVGTAYVGLLWNPRVWAISAAIFYVPYFLLFTTFFTNGGDIWNFGGDFWSGNGGFWTGTWGSLDYWLDQQLVRRGSQPDFYYFMFLPVYEFLPLVFALGGALFYAFRGRLEQQLLAASALLLVIAFSLMPDGFPLVGQYHVHISFIIAISAVLLLPMEAFTKFLLFWTLAILFSITIAGEKMPWLAVHLAVPLALLAAKVLDDVLSPLGEQIRAVLQAPPARGRGQRRRKEQTGGFNWEHAAPVASVVLGAGFAFVAALLFLAYGPASGLSAIAWILSLAALGVVVWAGANVSWRTALPVAAVALFAALSVFYVRAGGIAAYDQGDPGGAPPELLIYAQGSPSLGVIRDDIDELARSSGLGRELPILLDNGQGVNIWPWPWYLRNYRNVKYDDLTNAFAPEPGSVALVSLSNRSQVEPYMDKVVSSNEYTHMWWFPERYRDFDGEQPTPLLFLGNFFSGDFFSVWRGYFIDRELPGATASPDRIAYFFSSDFEPIEIVPTVPPEVEGVLSAESQTIIGGPGDGQGLFSQPAGMAFDQEGNLYVVDTLNQRVQVFAPDGTFVDSFGASGHGPGEFANPNDDDEQFTADGPWGIEIDQEGNIYVADTWNHRIQKFGPDLDFVLEWGADEGLFGPRDIAIDADGNLLVVDTGNKRVLKYTTDGELLETYGESGGGPGQFNEPSSISIAPNGDIYVADYWNRRVQHFDSAFEYIDDFRVGTWGSQGVTDRAYLVVLEDGTVLTTDPANGEVLVFDASGTAKAAWRLFPEPDVSRPVGIAIDSQGQVYISDGAASQVRRIPLSELLAPQAP